MQSLGKNLHSLLQFKKDIDSDFYIEHERINEQNIHNISKEDLISIVMTSHDRSRQVYHTLKTISQSSVKTVQVILVDDSDNDCVSSEKLKEFNLYIDLIRINKTKKNWANPCVNYNIGFKYIRGSKVIIQNAEVCHVGDVLQYVKNNVNDNKYHVFDVRTSQNFETNELLYKVYDEKDNMNVELLNRMSLGGWYQHYKNNNVNYHFLTALTSDTFNQIRGFSLDYSFGTCHDDNDLLLKIELCNIPIIQVCNDVHKVAGIHQYHCYHKSADRRAYYSESNQSLYDKKKRYIQTNKKYLEVSDGNDTEELVRNYNILNQY
jgi:hypothetical protein